MLNLCSIKLLLIMSLAAGTAYAQDKPADEKKQPIPIETKIRSESVKKPVEVFTPVDNSSKFKIDPKELSVIKAMDARTLKEKIEFMKDRITDAKSKLIETTKDKFSADTPLSYLSIKHKNDMGARYNLISLTYVLDGKKVFSDYDLYKSGRSEYSVYDAFITPGYHEVIVSAVYSGNGDGVFDYLSDYRVKTQKRHQFTVPDSRKFYLDVTGYKIGTIFTSFKNRPALAFDKRIEDTIAENIEK
ncbi:MAG: hypothetical protein V1647_01890 [Pseudomonadota bacterium]